MGGGEGVAVYRRPLDVLASLRSHVADRAGAGADLWLLRPLDQALTGFFDDPLDLCAVDDSMRETVARHYRETALSDRLPDRAVLRSADRVADHPGAVRRLARAIGVAVDPALVEAIGRATAFEAMRAEAQRYVPEPGAGFWRDDSGFFAQGGAGRCRKLAPPAAVPRSRAPRYAARMQARVPDPEARRWLEEGAAPGR